MKRHILAMSKGVDILKTRPFSTTLQSPFTLIIRNLKLAGRRPGLPGVVISFDIVPLDLPLCCFDGAPPGQGLGGETTSVSERPRLPGYVPVSLIFLDGFTAAEAEMIVFMTVRIHDPASVPKGRSPAAPIRVGIDRVENEPAAFHLRISQLQAAPARHLAFIKRKVHMLRSVSMQIVNS